MVKITGRISVYLWRSPLLVKLQAVTKNELFYRYLLRILSKKIWITLPILIVKFSINFWFENLICLFFRIKNLPFEFQDLSINFLNLYTFLNPYISCNLWFARNIGIAGFFDPCTYDVWSTEHLEFTFLSYLIFIHVA